MTVKAMDGPGGATSDNASGGQNQSQDNQNQSSDSNQEQNVSYETHRKLLGEKKRKDEELAAAKEKLAAFERQTKEREEAELKAKEDYKKLLEIRDKEAQELKQKLDGLETRFQDAKKLDSFLKSLNGQVAQKYWDKIDLTKVILDPQTGEIDQMSVTKAVQDFRNTFPEIIQTKGSTGLPQNAPGGQGQKLSYEDWRKLPAKEMKKRLKDMVAAENN